MSRDVVVIDEIKEMTQEDWKALAAIAAVRSTPAAISTDPVILDGDQMMPLEELRQLDAQLSGPTDMFRQKSEDVGGSLQTRK